MGTMPFTTQQAAAPANPRQESGRKRPPGWVIAIIIALALVFLVVTGGGAGYYFYNQHYYALAEASVARQAWGDAAEDLGHVAAIFKDSQKLMKYTQAGAALQDKDFSGARQLYDGLVGFMDSATMITETDYQEAQNLLAHNEFDRARELLATLGAYKDSPRLLQEADYQKGVSLLAQGNYQQAKDLFTTLGDYKDCPQKLQDADFQKAAALLKGGKYDDADELLSALALENYKDAVSLLPEARYWVAKELYGNKKYVEALDKIKQATGYKDSAALQNSIWKGLYNEAVRLYRAKDYSTAQDDFSLIPDYSTSSYYLMLIDARSLSPDASYTDTEEVRKVYNALKELGAFEDAAALRTNDTFLYFRLEGKWRGGGYDLILTADQKDGGWTIDFSLPYIKGKFFKLEDGAVWLGSEADGWTKNFVFRFLAENKVQVTCVKNGKTYTMTR